MRFVILSLIFLNSCTTFPQLDNIVSEEAKRADFPTLLPMEEFLSASHNAGISQSELDGLEGRIASLQSRAARLRGPVFDRATRARLSRFVQ